MGKNKVTSKNLARVVGGERGECYRSAAAAILTLKHSKPAWYVEGWVKHPSDPNPFHHAWVVVGEEIIDPALPEVDLNYREVGRWSREELQVEWEERDEFPITDATHPPPVVAPGA